MKYLPLLFIIISGLLITGCRKDKTDTQIIAVDPKGTDVDTDFRIWVTDLNNTPLEGVEIEVGPEKITTDENGIAWADLVNLDSEGAVVKISKSGFFTNYKRVIPLANNETYMQAALITKVNPSGVFNTDAGDSEISGSAGERIKFSANSIVIDESNTNYVGEVKVYTHHFNPSDNNIYSAMPGNLTGVDSEGGFVALETYGMLLVELEGEEGEQLNLKVGTTAEISLPLGPIAENAPTEIPLWSMNESNGLWVEEGKAYLEDNYYKGEVSHFSFWNCDVPYPLIELSGILLSDLGVPLPYAQILISTPSGISGYGVSNELGHFAGKVPKGVELTLAVYDHCQEFSNPINIGSFDMDENIGDLIVELPIPTQIIGSVLSCSGNPLENGYLHVNINATTMKVIPVIDGMVNATLSLCGETEITITAYDLSDLKQSIPMVFNIAGPILDIGGIMICEELDEYISVTFDQGEFLFTEANSFGLSAVIEGEFLLIYSGNGQDFTSFRIKGITNGTHELDYINISPEFSPSYGCGSASQEECQGIINAVITDFGGIDELIKGSMEGQVYFNQNLVDVTIEFKLKLDDIQELVSGVIWSDVNSNGIRESSETLLKGANMSISSAVGTTIFSTKDGGVYSQYVSTLMPFNIRITESNVSFSPQDVGSDDSVDSDFNSNGELFSQEVVLGSPITNLDGGLLTSAICDFQVHPSNCSARGATIQLGFTNTLPNSDYSYEMTAAHPDFPMTFTTTSNPFYVGDIESGLVVTIVASINGFEKCTEVLTMSDPTNMIEKSQVLTTNCSPPTGSILLETKPVVFGQDYSFNWSNGSSTQNIENASPGIYTVTVEDNYGCQEVVNFNGDFESARAIGGFVWLERGIAVDHVYNSSDELLDGIQVNLLDQNLTYLESAFTSFGGKYQFEGLNESGEYYIELPSGGPQNIVNKDFGTDDEIDSDIDPVTRRSDLISVGPACFVNNTICIGIQ